MPRSIAIAACATTVILGAAVLAPAADAASPFTQSNWGAFRSVTATGCTTTLDPSAPPSDQSLKPTGVSGTYDQTLVATSTATGASNDITTTTFTSHATGSVAGLHTDPTKVTVGFSGAVTVSHATSPSQCMPTGQLGTRLALAFDLSRPMWVTVSLANRDSAYTEVTFGSDGVNMVDLSGSGLKYNVSAVVYLPAGFYSGSMTGEVQLNGLGQPLTSSGAMTAVFAPAGALEAPPAGTGHAYVAFPSIRNCAKHTLTPAITRVARLADRLTRAVVYVNGRRVRTITAPRLGEAISLTLADDRVADVRIGLRIRGSRVVRHVAANYLSCT